MTKPDVLLTRLRTYNPVPPNAGPPKRAWSAATCLEEIENRSGTMAIEALTSIRQHFPTHWQCAMTYLERRYPREFGRRDPRTVPEEMPEQEDVDVQKLTAEELDVVIRQELRGA